MKRRRNADDGLMQTPDEIVRTAAISVINQLQDEIEAAMTTRGVTHEKLAASLGLTPAMVRHILDSPDAELRDLTALASILGLTFRVTGVPSR